MSVDPPTEREAPRRQRLYALLTLAIVVGFVALASEVALQVRDLRRAAAAQEAWSRGHEAFRIHPFLQVSPRPNPSPAVYVNRHGFRGPPLDVARTPGSLRVFALGGSTTFSAPVPYAETWPARLAEALRERAPGLRVEVQNAACDWYSSEHSLIRYLFDVRRFRPDVVVVFHAINDLYRGFAPEWFSAGPFAPDYSHYLGPIVRLERQSQLATDGMPFQESLLLRALSRLGSGAARAELDPRRLNPFAPGAARALARRQEPRHIDDFPSLGVFRENLGLLARILRQDGVALVLATQPSLYRADLGPVERRRLLFAPFFAAENGRYPDLASMERGMRRFNEAAERVAQAEGVPLIDLAAAVPRTADHFSDDVHMTPRALAIVAARVAEALEAGGYLSTRP